MADAKLRIAAAFSRAADRYESQASIQLEVARRLAARIALWSLPLEPRVLEIGAGTGFLSRLLLEHIPGGRWLLTDLSEAMLARCRARISDARVRFAVADAENPPPGRYDLIVSSLALQWLVDLGAGLSQLAARLSRGGTLAFATLGQDTFHEWRAAHSALGLSCGARSFPSAQDVDAMWPARGSGALEEERCRVQYGDARAFVRSLKAVGAATSCDGHRPLGPAAFKRVVESLGPDCTVTYHLLFGRFTAAGQER